jgi:hypothetical protein
MHLGLPHESQLDPAKAFLPRLHPVVAVQLWAASDSWEEGSGGLDDDRVKRSSSNFSSMHGHYWLPESLTGKDSPLAIELCFILENMVTNKVIFIPLGQHKSQSATRSSKGEANTNDPI